MSKWAFTSDFFCFQDYFVQHWSVFKLHDSFVLAASSKFPLSEEFKTLGRSCCRPVIETNIEGIDREFKVTKAQKAFHNKSGGYTHPLEVMKTTV
jgi:hypothetical protein